MQKLDSSPVRGTRDILPAYARLRRTVVQKILGYYTSCGFNEIETPALERKDVLFGAGGNENEKLTFQVMKRGEKLISALNSKDESLTDSGLRFDLTLPLSRFYAANSQKLSMPFKSVQIGQVWRAERPQLGRFRQFIQCDIDIIGDKSLLAELDLLASTAACLNELGFFGFTVKINHRVILNQLLITWGVPETIRNDVLIVLDKLDKIGKTALLQEIGKFQLPDGSLAKIESWLASTDLPNGLELLEGQHSVPPAVDAVNELVILIRTLESLSGGKYSVMYDPTMIRGMGYYTGLVFEISYKDYPFSIAGGGRYDNMIERFAGRKVPACGFSIGFDRVVSIIEKEELLISQDEVGAAVVYDSDEDLHEAYAFMLKIKQEFRKTNIVRRTKNQHRQLTNLLDEKYTYAFYKVRGVYEKVLIQEHLNESHNAEIKE
ncbi:histidine--tRNA ligase [Pseudomonas graminis]|uniref:histidine--tRNA ligase n=1 Tax=Pseudomonas graminis TaxID=158627 RepID=UPI00234BCBFB|nr:histidine--tRNA ligase [Pseudomonas graminis]MDC6379899.1 histidine--tRNA ligase [Pseudomonas graminis]